jgi:hypothetical protein
MDDELWDLYADALIECEVDGSVRCLRGPDADSLPADAPIFVMTAYNPGGVDRDQARNVAGEEALERDLALGGATIWAAIGRSPDASWSEPGVAVADLDRSEACSYGRRYGQLAVYELTEDAVHVVRCLDGEVVRTGARTSARG